MNKKDSFISKKDGAMIEADISLPSNPICYLLIWPCSMCSCGMYKLPKERFASSGIATIQFNPRAHGKSAGSFNYEHSFEDLKHLCDELLNPGIPIACLGHSGGAGALLKAEERIGIDRLWLVSPVLDSRESIYFMYETGGSHEFTDLIASLAVNPDPVKKILETPDWIDSSIWNSKNLKKTLDDLSESMAIGSLLEAIFIPGYNAFDEFLKLSEKIEIIYPLKDSWYPESTVMRLAFSCNVPVIRDLGGKDHYFTGAWKNIWNYIEKRLVSLYSQS